MPFFDRVPLAPPDPILGLTASFNADARPGKVNLGVGLYKDEELRTPILQSVKMAEAALLKNETHKEYLPIDGDPELIVQIGGLIFGEKLWKSAHARIAGFQAVGGTGGLKLGGTFLKEEAEAPVYIPVPTWPNHRGVFLSCGLKVEPYPYYDTHRHELVYNEMVAFLGGLAEGSVVVLHACCHNPTGCDPTEQQWRELAELFAQKKLLPFFDCAYQGLGRGLVEDVQGLQIFMEKGLELLVSFSAAKNFSLYGERVGAFYCVCNDSEAAVKVKSRVKQMIRTNYSNPPLHGAKIVALILSDPILKKLWEEELLSMRTRINRMRGEFSDLLGRQSKKRVFSHISAGLGMFCFTGLNQVEVEQITSEYGIYMTGDGRINLCGLNRNNIDYVANAIVTITG